MHADESLTPHPHELCENKTLRELENCFFLLTHHSGLLYAKCLSLEHYLLMVHHNCSVLPGVFPTGRIFFLKKNSTEQHLQEKKIWLVKQMVKAIIYNLLYLTHVDALSAFVANSLHIFQPQSPSFSDSFSSFFFCFCSPASHPLSCPFAGNLLNLGKLFFSPCDRSVF